MENGKLELEEIIGLAKHCDKKVSVKAVAELFELCLGMMYNEGEMMKKLEKKCGKEFWDFIMSLEGTFLATLFGNVQYDSDKEKLQFGSMIGDAKLLTRRKKEED